MDKSLRPHKKNPLDFELPYHFPQTILWVKRNI